jgi:hypothetical protein
VPDKTPASAGFLFPIHVIAIVAEKKTKASTAVAWDKKLAEPLAPKTLPEAPEPKAAPISAPLPCCNRTNKMIARAEHTCTTINAVFNHSMVYLQLKILCSANSQEFLRI